MNFDKTEYPVVGAKAGNLDIDGRTIRNCNEFRYLGSVFNKERNSEKDIDNGINQGRKAIKQLNGIRWNNIMQRKEYIDT